MAPDECIHESDREKCRKEPEEKRRESAEERAGRKRVEMEKFNIRMFMMNNLKT